MAQDDVAAQRPPCSGAAFRTDGAWALHTNALSYRYRERLRAPISAPPRPSSFLQTRVLTDIPTGWSECIPVRTWESVIAAINRNRAEAVSVRRRNRWPELQKHCFAHRQPQCRTNSTQPTAIIDHANLRGPDYFHGGDKPMLMKPTIDMLRELGASRYGNRFLGTRRAVRSARPSSTANGLPYCSNARRPCAAKRFRGSRQGCQAASRCADRIARLPCRKL